MQSARIKRALLDGMANLPVVDTHEHYSPEQYWSGEHSDFFDLLCPYACDDLISAGMPPETWAALANKALPIAERLALLSPYLPYVRFGSYFRVVDAVARKRYGLREYTAAELERIRPQIARDFSREGFDLLKSEGNIRHVLTFLPFDCHHAAKGTQMRVVPTVSDIDFSDVSMITKLSSATGARIDSFAGLLKALDALFEQYASACIRDIKVGSAYRRRLDFKPRAAREAENAFMRVLAAASKGDESARGGQEGVYERELITLDDYLAYYMVGLAGKHGMGAFIHCGLHAWNFNEPQNAQAGGLRALIATHPGVRFTLLHCGVPYFNDALLLCKYYPNVVLNMTWLHVIDRVEGVRLCERLLDMIPLNKIEAFGGDYFSVPMSLEHLAIVKEAMACALSPAIVQGRMTLKDALEIAGMWLYDNPARHYGLE